MCKCGQGKAIVVPYMFRGDRRAYVACSHCDLTDLWGNFVKTSPPIPKE